MTRPGSALWLLANELRLFWRRGTLTPKSGLILAAGLVSAWLVISFFILQRIGPAIPPPPFLDGPGDGLTLLAVGVIIAFIGSVMLASATLATVDVIYLRNDLDLLLSSPISPWRILTVRTSAIAVGALPVYAGLLGPPLLWLALFSSPRWLFSIVFLVTLAFAATAVALLIVTVLFRLIGPKKTRVAAQILSAVFGAGVFLTFQYLNYFNFSAGGELRQDQQQLTTWITSLSIDPHSWWLLPARASTADPVSFLAWVAGVSTVFPLSVFIFSRRFVSDAAAAAGTGRSRHGVDARVAHIRGGFTASVMRKELRLLLRDPLLLSQIGMQMLYLLPLGFILLQPGTGVTFTAQAFAPVLTLLASTLAGSLVWITVSAEDAPDLIASAPVPAGAIDRAKLFAAVLAALTLMAPPLAILAWRDPVSGGWALAGVLAASFASALIGLWRRSPGSRRDFVRRRQKPSMITGLGQAVVVFGLSGAIALCVYGFPLVAIVPALIACAILGALYKPPGDRLA